MAEVITELFEMCGQSKDEGRKILVKHTNKSIPSHHLRYVTFRQTSQMIFLFDFFQEKEIFKVAVSLTKYLKGM